ncbi:Histidyl-tRNA synthetase [Liberibacter crescens BT-1]|uniref:Histidine--tRNA ligase n=1 Tax=Liberibacter crescens (strain BT-1) TaxID=1215343 RepID=L0EX84_LIBCB|nr:histidine--tRNA ligase [Liberibacter crescens]AGA64981.1 Histidyl-tRNA synthetase [Liberibacter crescens BT-1]AMC12999.1 histidyl-tRNA synthase [Liberibacter crescens]
MKKKIEKPLKLISSLPRGFVDHNPNEVRMMTKMMNIIRDVYERYGFDPIETPLLEYSDALGQFLCDDDRPNKAVFSLQDEDNQWMSLRYDLTAPLARHVAENFQEIQFPYRTYRFGHVFRNEKPGPGRFRQFMQCDADNIGATGEQTDAEMCMMMADTLEAVGIRRGDYKIVINNRKILDGILEKIGLSHLEKSEKKLTVLRAIDKLDKFGLQGVKLLLAEGRVDESGDFTKGANLTSKQIDTLMLFISITDYKQSMNDLEKLVNGTATGEQGLIELNIINDFMIRAGYNSDRIKISPSVVRGLEYYTSTVYEAQLQFPVTNTKNEEIVFGSVGGGGRYDGLISRFREQNIPAIGFSIGLSRLISALKNINTLKIKPKYGPVLVTVMDYDMDSLGKYQEYTQILRTAGIPTEMFQGNSKKLGNQLKYADRRNSPVAIIQGKDERNKGVLQIKDLIRGKKLAQEIDNNLAWREARVAQTIVNECELVLKVKEILNIHSKE